MNLICCNSKKCNFKPYFHLIFSFEMAEAECPVLHKTEEPKEVDIYRDTPVRLLGLSTFLFFLNFLLTFISSLFAFRLCQ